MLRVIDEKGLSFGYKCSECLSDVAICDTICENCGRELVYPYFMPSTAWWERHEIEAREKARRDALDITIALIWARGTDWRDLQAPLNRFLNTEKAETSWKKKMMSLLTGSRVEMKNWEPKEVYPYFGNKLLNADDIKRIESQLPITLIDEKYLS